MEEQDHRNRNRKTLDQFMSAIGGRDFAALESICTSDLVAELPYSDPPARFEGFHAYRSGVSPLLEIYRFSLSLSEIHSSLDPDLIVAEYTSEGTAIPTGKPYRNVYIGLFRFREGRICHLREFFNPLLGIRALESD
jgi:ketosteroid isomerase-like protein